MASHAAKPTTADGVLRWIGDLDHPFYRDERQRFVWYEASVIGFQLVLFLQLTIAPLVALLAPGENAGLTALMTLPPLVAGGIIVAYASAKGAPFAGGTAELRRPRTYLLLIPMALVALVVIRFGMSEGASIEFGGNSIDGRLLIAGLVPLFAGIGVGLSISRSREASSDVAAPAAAQPYSNWDRVLRWIGDLAHPFYNDERQRFVWYEASAIGFQLILLVQFASTGLLLAVAGRSALLAALVGIVPASWAAIAVLGYVNRRGVRYFPKANDIRRSRGLAGLGLVLIYVMGMLRLAFDIPAGASSFERGFASAMPLGFAVGLTAAVVGAWIGNRKQLAADELDDDF